jgi:hypothetical protein
MRQLQKSRIGDRVRLPVVLVIAFSAVLAWGCGKTEPVSEESRTEPSQGAGESQAESLYVCAFQEEFTPLLFAAAPLGTTFGAWKDSAQALPAPEWPGTESETGGLSLVILWRPGMVLDCIVCFDTFLEVERLRRQRPERLRVEVFTPIRAVSLVRSVLDEEDLPWPVFGIPWRLVEALRGARATPFLILLDEQGRLLASWYPGPTPEGQRAVLRVLGALLGEAFAGAPAGSSDAESRDARSRRPKGEWKERTFPLTGSLEDAFPLRRRIPLPDLTGGGELVAAGLSRDGAVALLLREREGMALLTLDGEGKVTSRRKLRGDDAPKGNRVRLFLNGRGDLAVLDEDGRVFFAAAEAGGEALREGPVRVLELAPAPEGWWALVPSAEGRRVRVERLSASGKPERDAWDVPWTRYEPGSTSLQMGRKFVLGEAPGGGWALLPFDRDTLLMVRDDRGPAKVALQSRVFVQPEDWGRRYPTPRAVERYVKLSCHWAGPLVMTADGAAVLPVLVPRVETPGADTATRLPRRVTLLEVFDPEGRSVALVRPGSRRFVGGSGDRFLFFVAEEPVAIEIRGLSLPERGAS